MTAAWAVDLLYLHITAGAAEQGAYDTKDRTQQQHLADVERVYAALPADRYPAISALRGPLLSAGDREHWGVQVLLNGILNTPASNFRR